MTILIVEDDESILYAISLLLESEGHIVWGAENGSVALEILEHRPFPDLILLDMTMPVMNGWQFATEVRRLYGPNPRFIVMTAAADAQQRAKDIGAAAWIGKPFQFEDLLALIKL